LKNKGIRRPTRATTPTKVYSIYECHKEIFMPFVVLVGRRIPLFFKNGSIYL